MKHISLFRTGVVVLIASVIAFLLVTRVSSQSQEEAASINEETHVMAQSAVSSPLFSYQGQLTNSTGNPVDSASLPMTFKLFPVATEGTACWAESQLVSVENGLFNVLLGQTTAIPTSCVTDTAYLELVVNGETMTPREMLASVAMAVIANTLASDAQTQGPLMVNGSLTTESDLWVGGWIRPKPVQTDFAIDNPNGSVALVAGDDLKLFIDSNHSSSGAALTVYRNSFHLDDSSEKVMSLSESGEMVLTGPLTTTSLKVSGGVGIGNDLSMGTGRALRSDGNVLHLMPWTDSSSPWNQVCIACGTPAGGSLYVNGNATVSGSLAVGSCQTIANSRSGEDSSIVCDNGSITSGAYIESNLMTTEERAAEKITRFEEGDLLCWSAEQKQLELCSQENDPLVTAVADSNGKPIVLGAEVVKVIGPVKTGDYLVTSSQPGYAMASSDPEFGIVIGQALEDWETGRGVILVMIRKM